MEQEAAHSSQILNVVMGIVLLMLVAALTTMLSKRWRGLPLTIALVLIGILLAVLSHGYGEYSEFLAVLGDFKLTPELVLFVFIPTLIFESAFNLDARQVARNILPIITLAVPGLLLSTAIIGMIMWTPFTPFELMVALLLGAILSATDPVAVIALFKQLGVPERLTVLVEGESLFNDATALVLALLLLEIMEAGVFTGNTVVAGVGQFLFVFLGGVLVGWAAALVVGTILGTIESDPFIEITFTTILAYFSFIIAEHFLHVSGIMAVVAAGLMIGSWGKTKISPSTAEFMEHFWEYLAYLANALIFLMVGIQIDLVTLWQSVDLIGLVIVAMLVSRAVVVFGLVPLVERLPGLESIEIAFKEVMYWGGLRGAIALAIVLSLPDFDSKDTLIAVVMGAVLFTLIVQGLSIEALVKLLGLNKLNMTDELARLEGDRNARREGMDRIENLVQGGLFSERIAEFLKTKLTNKLDDLELEINEIHDHMRDDEEIKVLGLRCMAREKARYYELFRRGLISEWAYRELDYTATIEIEDAKHLGELPTIELEESTTKTLSQAYLKVLASLPGFNNYAEKLRTRYIIRDYDVAWGRYRAANSVLNSLDAIAKANRIEGATVEKVREAYVGILNHVKIHIDEVAEQYPEFVDTVQGQLGERLLLIAEQESVEHEREIGILPDGIAKAILKDQAERLRSLKQHDVSSALEVDVHELLRKVDFLQNIDESAFEPIIGYLRSRTVPRGSDIIRQGAAGDSLFLIARGVAKVFVDGGEDAVATLYAGDLFGEAALLHGTPRNATIAAATPCTLYELNRAGLDRIFIEFPDIKDAVERVDRERLESGNETAS